MKRVLFLFGLSTLTLWSSIAFATFTSGSTGADGPFNPASNIEVVLPPDGVLNYTTVDIPAGVTVTFKKNAVNTPVYMLATGDVTIAGTLNVNAASTVSTVPGSGGNGGFSGGYGGATGFPGSKGLGPGGGSGTFKGGGGGFGTLGGSYSTAVGGPSYGNQRLLPLIGGSGGGGLSGSSNSEGKGGGGGGGALLIASSGSITVTGSITANGGNASLCAGVGGGSGGAIKLVANTINGEGTLSAKGGSLSCSERGGAGRIRLEAFTISRATGTDPPYSFGDPSNVFPSAAPTLSITSIAGYPVPPNTTGAYNQPDIPLPSSTSNPVAVDIAATNIPAGTTVRVWVIPQYGSATSVDAILSGTDQASTASASVNLSTTYSNIVTAEATFTILQAMYWNDEKIDKVKVATSMGGVSETVYISKSGKEIAGNLIAGIRR